jgi:hypothetical protein
MVDRIDHGLNIVSKESLSPIPPGNATISDFLIVFTVKLSFVKNLI